MKRRLTTGAALSMVAFSMLPAAWAHGASADDVSDLARDALDSDTALERLRQITDIDGTPVDLRTALDTTDRTALEQRLDTLAQVLDGADIGAEPDPSVVLDEILAEQRFQVGGTSVIDRVLERIGAWWSNLIADATGGNGAFNIATILAIAAVIALVAVAGILLTRRRAAVLEERTTLDRLIEQATDPSDLEARADAASRAGDHSDAVRLRFVAGILRLDQRGRITYAKGLTTAEIGELVDDPAFDDLRRDFDRVVYGNHPADAATDQRSIDGWRNVLHPAGVT